MVTDEMVDAAIKANTEAKLFGGEPRDWVRAALEAALSAAEPQPAPSVAVKALEWKKTPASEDALPEWTSHDPKDGMYTVSHDGRDWRVVRHFIVIGRKKTLQDAKELAQSHYDARIRSALSAQVQDVAGWQPIETAPKDGSSVLGFWSYTYLGDKEPTTGIEIIEWHDGKFHGWRDSDGVTQDGVYTHWMLLPEAPAAPAKQEG